MKRTYRGQWPARQTKVALPHRAVKNRCNPCQNDGDGNENNGNRLRCKGQRICIWPNQRSSKPRIWTKLRDTLGERLFSKITHLTKVTEKGLRGVTRVRFDVYLRSQRKRILRQIHRSAKSCQWYAKKHTHWHQRRLRRHQRRNLQQEMEEIEVPPPAPPEEIEETWAVREEQEELATAHFSTWNINHLTGKRPEIEMYLKESRIDILCLQETWREDKGWPVRIRGYTIFESPAKTNQPGQNGLAILIKSTFMCYEVGTASPYFLMVKVVLGKDEWVIVNTYIPPASNDNRRNALRAIKTAITEASRGGSTNVLVAGDWNMSVDEVTSWLQRRRRRHLLKVLEIEGDPYTFIRGEHRSTLDHVVVSEPNTAIGSVRVNSSWDISDHLAVEATISFSTDYTMAPLSDPFVRFDSVKIKEKAIQIANHNIWDAFLEDDDDNNEDMAERFDEVVQNVGTNLGLRQENATSRNRTYLLSPLAKRAIQRRRRLFKIWKTQEFPRRNTPLWERYVEAKKEALKVKRQSMRVSWEKYLAEGAKRFVTGPSKQYWKWLDSISGRKHQRSKPSLLGPVLSEGTHGHLAYGPEATQVWWRYFCDLFSDDSGRSKSREYWIEKIPDNGTEPLPEMDTAISWVELNSVLMELKTWKAPGMDGVPFEFFRVAAEDPTLDTFDDSTPQTALGQALLKIANHLLTHGIPPRWNSCALVTILKKGDPKNLSNYRGIALIRVCVKIVTIIINQRIRTGLETKNFIRSEQAGFRSREECVGQACALYDVIQRRLSEGKPTYATFIDFKKAYDLVPHEALLRKLHNAGVRGKCFRFLQSQYSDVFLNLRSETGYLRDQIPVLRGLRQGCPASPDGFNVFINDMLDNTDGLGVRLNGIDDKVAMLLFADDVVLLSYSTKGLRKSLKHLETWSTNNEMQFGIPKCAVMGFGEGAKEKLLQRRGGWKLHGQPLSIVDEYEYLGLIFSTDLNRQTMADTRAEKGMKALHAQRHVISCQTIPIQIRIQLVKSCLVPILTYGGELWGMVADRCQAPQRVLNRAMKLLVGMRETSVAAAWSTISMELDIPSINSITAASRARAITKYRTTSRTVIGNLCRHPPATGGRQSWVRGTQIWLKMYFPRIPLDATPDQIRELVKKEIWRKDLSRKPLPKSLTNYQLWNYEKTNGFIKKAMRFSYATKGIRWLIRCRLGAFWTVPRLISFSSIPSDPWRRRCPCCHVDLENGETFAHLLVQCTHWEQLRRRHLGNVLDWISQNVLAGDNQTWSEGETQLVAALLCGGSWRTPTIQPQNLGGVTWGPIIDPIPNWGGDHGCGIDDFTDIVPEHHRLLFVDAAGLRRPCFVQTAIFLAKMIALRWAILSSLVTPRADANDPNHGMVAFNDDNQHDEIQHVDQELGMRQDPDD